MKIEHKSKERDWHEWFAWRPVTVREYLNEEEDKIFTVWLTTVERKIQSANGWLFSSYRFKK